MAIESFMSPEAKQRFLKLSSLSNKHHQASISVSFDILPPGFSKLLRRIPVAASGCTTSATGCNLWNTRRTFP